MKKLLYTLLAVTIIFSSCEKEEENSNSDNNNNNNNNNNSTLVLEQTVWQLQSYEIFDTIRAIPNNNDPVWGESGLSTVSWMFFNNNEWLIQEYIGNNNVIIKDTSIYSFYSGINIINLDYNGYTNEFSLTNLGQDNNLVTSLNIISFSNNNLVLEGTFVGDDNNSYKIRFNLIKQ